MLPMLIVTSSFLTMTGAVSAAADGSTTTKRDNKSAELEEGMFSLLVKFVRKSYVHVMY